MREGGVQHIEKGGVGSSGAADVVKQSKYTERWGGDELQHVRVVCVVDHLPLDALAHVHLFGRGVRRGGGGR